MNKPRDTSPAIETLSDVSWQRVEKNLFAALDCDAAVVTPVPTARRWQPWAIAGGLAVACSVAVIVLVRPTTSSSRGGDVATAPSRVVTQDAPSEVTYGDATITVDAQSAMTIDGDAQRGVGVVLERGSATFAVAPRENRPPFIVTAGDVTVRVIGTRFSVSRSGDAALVHVDEGHVEVVARGLRVQVRAGESWPAGDDWEAVIGGQAANQGGNVAAHFDSNGQPLGGGLPGDARSGDGSTHDGLPWEGQSSAGAAANPRPRQRTSRPAPAPAPAPVVDDDRTRFLHAQGLETSDPRAALAEYKEILKHKGPWTANALYAAGRLAVDLGDGQAAVYLRAYLQRFPKGANAADAQRLLDQLGQ